MTFPTTITAFTSLLIKLSHRRVAYLVMALLFIYAAYISANITWLFFPQSNEAPAVYQAQFQHDHTTDKLIKIEKIQSLNLFGHYDEKTEETVEVEVSNVPETKLNLVLTGLVASDEDSIAAAIIENQGKQNTYSIDDTILGTRAHLEQVLIDRVIIKHSGRLETLMLDGFDYNEPAKKINNQEVKKNGRARVKNAEKNITVIDQRKNLDAIKAANDFRADFFKEPSKINDYFLISQKRKHGKIIGYAIRPGRKPALFKLSGLKMGDVAVQMNGYDLTAVSEAGQALSEMKKARTISLLVARKGGLAEILLSLD